RYPSAARRDGVEGVAVVRVYLDAKGAVTDVAIVTSTGDPRLDDAALAEVKARWRFTPRYEDGAPVASTVKARLEFRLNR
ncbi:MAG TPA: energy transducer TonB, partial [Armatimonadota bacterium]|nr:energy transducer TonB [Armatimonadota bacterium]